MQHIPLLPDVLMFLRRHKGNVLTKKALVGAFLAVEVCAYSCFYLINPLGLRGVLLLKAENREIAKAIKQLQGEIDIVKQEIQEWKEYPWLQEKRARQELQMLYPGEEIFLID